MATHQLKHQQIIPVSLEETWEFFSNPGNLKHITPAHMDFKVLSGKSAKVYPGQIIEYSVKPLLRIPLYWMTEITQVKHQAYFIDEQRFGPYAFWHHQHFFSATPEGTSIEDIVHYRLPLGWIGDIAHRLFIRKQLEQIFTFRAQFIKQKWPSSNLGV